MSEYRFPFLDLKTVNEQYIDRLRDAATRVIESGRYIGGFEVKALEDKLSGMLGADHAVGVSNGLDALRLSLRAFIELGMLHKGDEIIVPANTYVASVLAVTDTGLTPVLVDPDERLMVLTGDVLEKHVTASTKAVMPVHLYGRVAWDAKMKDIIRANNLIVLEDAAQSIGAVARVSGLNGSNKAGALGHAGALSFYPTKNVGALGDAGAVLTHSPAVASAVRALSNYGSDVRYHNIYKGFNCRLDPLQAAMLSVKLDYCSVESRERFARAVAYENTIDNPLVTKPVMSDLPIECVWHQYVIRCDRRDELREFLAQNGVETDVHYAVPPHKQPCYSELKHGPLPLTELIANQIISLPVNPSCTSVKDASDIGRIINQFK